MAAQGAPPQQQAPAAAPAPAPAVPANLPPNALRGFLVSYQSNTQGDFWALNGGRKTIGRANAGEQVDIPLSDATISSRHAALVVDGAAGTVQIEDTGSTNGTFVNEEHIGFNGKRDLRDGDKIRFGGYTTIVKVIGRM
jgi:pSer/pThr/pTyr-binding forkhead associated (FHA) protein